MPYVQRDGSGAVVGRFAAPQEDATEWVEEAALAPDLGVLRGNAAAMIDAAAGSARARYITVAPGQEATYLLKAQAAQAFAAAGFTGPVPPFVAAEADAAGVSPADAAAAILAQENTWLAIAVEIERHRRGGKVAVASAANEAAVTAAAGAAVAALAAI